MTLSRRTLLLSAAAVSLAGACGVGAVAAADGDMIDLGRLMSVALPDRALGPDNAAVTVIEYASPTCPHCAAFHNAVYPEFKARYIETGKVRFIVRPFSRNVLDTAIFLLAEAAGEEMYHDVIGSYFATQDVWMMSDRPRDALLAQAIQLGFTEEMFDAALTNQEMTIGIETMRNQAIDEFGLTGTPTFYVNGKTLTGERSLEELAAAIDPLLPAEQAPAPQPAAPATPDQPAANGASTPVAPASPATPTAP